MLLIALYLAQEIMPPLPPLPLWVSLGPLTETGSPLAAAGEHLPPHPFELLHSIDLKWLSCKTAFLLAITSAKWVGELQALSAANT